ncbi:winged helix-turn-helix domain-containing protein [Luteitalea pratensis]|uniref:winged helix-turn-helix domain-containing protein n=1 Tax=Luteitalea pratensis TaxID=1855912 RepID=UPI0012FFBAED|nr:winged helix-turn-helix domain-containing protein [Luteitalea pratensis]
MGWAAFSKFQEDFVGTSMSSGTIHLYEFGPYRLDVQRHVLLRADRIVPLAPKTFDLLLLLVQSEGRALSKHALMTALWPDTFVEEGNLSFQIATLRKALNGEARWIETIPKHGYRFSADVRTITRSSAAEQEAGPASKSAIEIGNPVSASGISATPSSGPVSKRSLRLWIGGGVVLILTAVLALWLAMRTREQPAQTMRESQLTAYEGFETESAFSPDGNQVVFVWDRDGANSDMYVRLIGAGQPVPLTNTPEREFSPAWSPDGRWIAFLRGELLNASLFVMPAIDGTERKIAESGPAGVIGGTVRWSPDGKWLLVSGTTEKDERIGLLLIDFNTGEKRRLTTPPAPMSDRGGSFSPDGRQVGFLRRYSQSPQGNTYLLNVDASVRAIGEAKRLETGGLQMGPPVWTSDGKELVFHSSRAGRGGLWRVSVAGGTPVRIVGAGNDARSPRAPD